MNDRELVERIYHLNYYKSKVEHDSLETIKIKESGRWSKGRNEIYDNGIWIIDGKKHRVDGPAKSEWDDGKKISEEWYIDGKLHRKDGPAVIRWSDGKKTIEKWYIDDKQHRVDGPAVIMWKDGKKSREEWIIDDGKLHRVDGPAVTMWSDGKKREEWYINGKQLTDTQFFEAFVKMHTKRG